MKIEIEKEEYDRLVINDYRYRWLRGNNSNWHVERWDGGSKTVHGTWRVISQGRLDAAIDAARSGGEVT